MAQPLTDAINALTRYANETTGASDTTLSDAVETLVEGYGQGGGGGEGLQLVDTITVPEDTRSYSFDLTAYADYDTILVYEDVELSANDWLYYVKNGTEPSGGSYNNGSRSHHVGFMFWRMPLGGTGAGTALSITGLVATYQFNQSSVGSPEVVNSIYIYTYSASKHIKAGSTFKIYAGNIL